jgi:hypothetical protein
MSLCSVLCSIVVRVKGEVKERGEKVKRSNLDLVIVNVPSLKMKIFCCRKHHCVQNVCDTRDAGGRTNGFYFSSVPGPSIRICFGTWWVKYHALLGLPLDEQLIQQYVSLPICTLNLSSTASFNLLNLYKFNL